jgi:UDP:flavonoid glycosyltransferase YjiC (YdhE family)
MKPLLLIFPFDQLSHYLRCINLAKQLRPYFQIRFAHSDKYISFLVKEDFQTFSCLSFDSAVVMKQITKFEFSWLTQKTLEPVFRDQVRAINELKPLAVLGDANATLRMATEKTGVKYISLMNGYMTNYYSFTRKLSKTHPAYKVANFLPAPLENKVTEWGERIKFRQIQKAFNKIRKQHGLEKVSSYLDELEGAVNLVCDLTDLFPQKALPSHFKIIPPLYYDAAIEQTGIIEMLDGSKKTIFVSMGSTGDWKKVTFLNHAYFKKYNIVAAGDINNILSSSNIIKRDFIYHRNFLPHVHLVICHGGNGTIYQALSYCIPLLCVTTHFEQEWNVQSLEKKGLGKSLDEVTRMNDYFMLIEEWIEKRNTDNFIKYGKKIRDELNSFPEKMKELAAEIISFST